MATAKGRSEADPSRKGAGGRRRGRVPRKATKAHLENAALWYLARFQATAASLERVLMRRVIRSARHHGTDPEQGREWVRALIARHREAGLIDDDAFARARAETLNRRGLSRRAIAAKLAEKGVARAHIDAALEALEAGSAEAGGPDLAAARLRARKRGLGPWRRGERRERREKDLAALARAGFSYAVARRVIDGDRED